MRSRKFTTLTISSVKLSVKCVCNIVKSSPLIVLCTYLHTGGQHLQETDCRKGVDDGHKGPRKGQGWRVKFSCSQLLCL